MMEHPSNAAEFQKMAAEFFAFAQAEGAKYQTVMGNIWDEHEGWRTYIGIGPKVMAFNSWWGLTFARRCKENAEKQLRCMTEVERAALGDVLGFFDDLEAQCKETMALRASGAKPEDVAAPARGAA